MLIGYIMNLNIAVIGAGSFGTAIAQLASNNVKKVYLYARRKSLVENIINTGYNQDYYPSLKLNDNIIAINTFEELNDADIVFLCIPSLGLRKTLKLLIPNLKKDVILVNAAKGIEYPSLKSMSTIISEYIETEPVVLSGPNFAYEVAASLFTISNIASHSEKNLKIVKRVLDTNSFKCKANLDIIGTEWCGVIKNINAIAYGLCEGMNLNDNIRYAVLTKGFNETMDIIESLGGLRETVHDYCGFGDLVLTSTSKESRNHTMGMLYGQRLVVDEKASGIIFEGKNSIKAVKDICDNNNVDSVVVNFVYDVIINSMTPIKAFKKLWEIME